LPQGGGLAGREGGSDRSRGGAQAVILWQVEYPELIALEKLPE
jgi:hypothetical protein